MAKIGDRFSVSAEEEVDNGKGRILARYLPGHAYRITQRNLDAVLRLIDEGKATALAGEGPARGGFEIASAAGAVRGSVST